MLIIDVLGFIALASIVIAAAVPLLKWDGRITVSWGAVVIADVVILAIGYFALWLLSGIVASV